jgi:hypothetical protein
VVGSIDGWMEGVRTEVRKEGRAVGRVGREACLGKQRNSDSHFPRIQIRRQLIEVYLGLPQILNTNFKTVLHINLRPPPYTLFPKNNSRIVTTFRSTQTVLLLALLNK